MPCASGLATWWSMDALTASLRDTDMQVAVADRDVVVGVATSTCADPRP